MKDDFTIKRNMLDGVPAFLKVAEHRSFRAAATELGVSPSALSQTVKTLEKRLGIALFQRTTRSVGLTQAGERFLALAEPAMRGLGEALDAARALGERPSGLLRVNASRGVIASLVAPVVPAFLAAHPDVDVEIFADDGLADIVRDGFDVGFRLGEAVGADMVAVRASPPFRFVVCGSPAYFDRRGVPLHPDELRDHDCIRFRLGASRSFYRWEFAADGRLMEIAVDGRLVVNDTATCISGALASLGLCHVAEPLVEHHLREGALRIALEDYAAMTPGVFLYFPSRAHVMPKLRAFVDHMRGALANHMRAGSAI